VRRAGGKGQHKWGPMVPQKRGKNSGVPRRSIRNWKSFKISGAGNQGGIPSAIARGKALMGGGGWQLTLGFHRYWGREEKRPAAAQHEEEMGLSSTWYSIGEGEKNQMPGEREGGLDERKGEK